MAGEEGETVIDLSHRTIISVTASELKKNAPSLSGRGWPEGIYFSPG